MSTEAKKEGSEESVDVNTELKNLKSEMNRKLGNIDEMFKKSQEELFQKISALQKPAPQAAPKENADLAELIYRDPEKYAQVVTERAKNQITKELEEKSTRQAAQTQVINSLYKDYPELGDDAHELTQLAIKKFNESSKGDNSPSAYKAAVYEAALELGVKPKSKRPTDSDEDFSVGGGGQRSQRGSRKKDELSEEVREAAAIFGVDPERVKARMSKRKSFTRWE